MAEDTKNIRISVEAHRWVTRVCGLTGESKSVCASRILLAALPADFRRLLAALPAEEQAGGPPRGPEPEPGAGPRRRK